MTYRGGQEPIVHLEADLYAVIRWAEAHGTPWAFSLSNAGARYTDFRSRTDDLQLLDWTAIEATDFRTAEVKERKQAEFLLHERFPFALVDRIGVRSSRVQARAAEAIAGAGHQPAVEVLPQWYF